MGEERPQVAEAGAAAAAGGAGAEPDSQQTAEKQEQEKYELVKLLIKRKADCTKQNANGETPLIKAVKKKYKTICQLIIMERCALNAIDHNKNTALFYSVRDKDTEIVDVLLGIKPHIKEKEIKNPADMSLKFQDDEYTYLHYAAWYRSPGICKALLRRKADVNAVGKDGHTPLSLACRSNHPRDQIISTLMKNGAKVRTADKYKNTPLHYAAFNGNLKAVEEIIKRPDVEIDARNIENATPLWNAVYHKHDEIVLRLLDKNADYNVASKGLSTVKFTDVTGKYYNTEKSALYVACEKSEAGNTKTEKIVKMLVAAGVDLEAEKWYWGLDGLNQERPQNLTQNQELIDWLNFQGMAIRSLQEFCGLAIRRFYGPNLDLMYESRKDVPTKLKDFVKQVMSVQRRLDVMESNYQVHKERQMVHQQEQNVRA